jgi:hypothetical protein
MSSSSSAIIPTTPSCIRLDPPQTIDESTRALEDTGIYETEDHDLRGFICPSPVSVKRPRPRTQLDLCLPPVAAFQKQGKLQPHFPLSCDAYLNSGEPNMVWPPILGQASLQWPTVFSVIHQPGLLWDCWKPSKTLDSMTVQEVWQCYNDGEPVFDANGEQTGIKPPLRLVEQHWKAEWRGGPAVSPCSFLLWSFRLTDCYNSRTARHGGG